MAHIYKTQDNHLQHVEVAFICSHALDENLSSERKENADLFEFLRSCGLNITWQYWDDPTVAWNQFHLVLIKAPWDYINKFDSFRKWIEEIESQKIKMLNPASAMRWNCSKKYLLEIGQSGLPVIPSRLLLKGSNPAWQNYFTYLKCDKLVIKPTIGSSARQVTLLSKDNYQDQAPLLVEQLLSQDYLIQPYLPEIQSLGEFSFIFFNGRYSHCVLKLPAANDYRVQASCGGSAEPVNPSGVLKQMAASFIKHFAANCFYARVDCVLSANKLLLMELELIEPVLFLGDNPQTFNNYYQALLQKMKTLFKE